MGNPSYNCLLDAKSHGVCMHCANVAGGRSRTGRQSAFDRVSQNAWRLAEVLLKAGFLKCNSGLCTKFGPRRNAFLVEARKQGST